MHAPCLAVLAHCSFGVIPYASVKGACRRQVSTLHCKYSTTQQLYKISAQPGMAVSRCEMLCSGVASIASWLQLRPCQHGKTACCALLPAARSSVSVHPVQVGCKRMSGSEQVCQLRRETCWLQVVQSGPARLQVAGMHLLIWCNGHAFLTV